MRWLGLDWDEGPEVGGPSARTASPSAATSTPTCSPGCASRRTPTTATAPPRRSTRAARRPAPRSWATTASAASSPTTRSPPSRPRAARPSSGSGCPTARSPATTWCAATSPSRPSTCPTSRSCRANGDPLYTLVNPVDDALMGITHVLRGEDLLSSTRARSRCTRRSVEIGVATATRVRPPALRHGRGQQEALQARPRGARCWPTASRASCPRVCSTTSPCWAGRSPPTATSSPSGDGRGVRHRRRQPQPGSLRPQEGRGDQRLAHAAAAAREITERVLPFLKRAGVVGDPGRRRRAAARAGHAAGRGADQQAHRGRRHARLPVRRRGRVQRDPTTRKRSTRPARASSRRRTTPSPGCTGWTHRRDRGGAARGAGRGAWGSSRATPSGRCGSR